MRQTERWKGRGVTLRVLNCVFGTHLFAGFIWLLTSVGENARK
ncbi:DUF6126 family protein [Streptomyces sp. NPDC051018]